MNVPHTITVVVGLGANLGDRLGALAEGVAQLHQPPHTRVVAVSRVYETEPLGPPQPLYLNAAARVETELSLRELLEEALAIERRLGRVRRERWGPRTLDIDLLWTAGEPFLGVGLVVPHPALMDRAFALAPLLDVLPDAEDEYRERLDALGGPPPVRVDSLPLPK